MTLVKFTLSCPKALADPVMEYLLESEWLTDGFVTLAASTHGADFTDASLSERVRGRVDQIQISAIQPRDHVGPLLEALRARFRAPQMRYWIEPIHEFGDFS